MPHTPQHRTASTVNQVLRTQARQNQQGQSPNVAAINVGNLQRQAGGFTPQLQPVANAISRGTTVPQLQQQNLADRQTRANIGLTRAQTGQVADLNRTNLRIARQPVAEQRVQQAGQLATATQQGADAFRTGAALNTATLNAAAIDQAGRLGVAGVQAGVQREAFASQERIANVTQNASAIQSAIQAQLESGQITSEFAQSAVGALGELLGNPNITDDLLATPEVEFLMKIGALGAGQQDQQAQAQPPPTVPQESLSTKAGQLAKRFIPGGGGIPGIARDIASPLLSDFRKGLIQ